MMRDFMLGDRVRYTGPKFYQELNAKTGLVVGYIENQKNVFVVDFGDDTYVVKSQSLKKTNAAFNWEPEQKRRHHED